MAYIVDYSIFSGTAAITATAMPMPIHQTGDLLIAFVTMGSGAASVGAGSVPAAASWTINSDATVAAATTSVLRTLATGSTNVLNLTTADDYAVTIVSVRDVDQTTPVDAISVLGLNTATGAPTSVAVSTTQANCLMLYMVGPDAQGATVSTHIDPPYHHLISHDNGSTTVNTSAGHGLGWTIHSGTGNSPAPGWTLSASLAHGRATVAVRNASGGRIPPYLDKTSPVSYLVPGHAIATVTGQTCSLSATNIMTGNMTNGKTTSQVAPQLAASADLGINVFSPAMSKQSATQAATALTGFEWTLTGARDFANRVIVGSVIGGSPKMGAYGIGSVAEGGCVVRIGSAAAVWKAYQVGAKDSNPATDTRLVFTIEPGFATSQYGTAGTFTTSATTNYIQFLSNQPSFASSVNWTDICLTGANILAGGTATNPIDTEAVAAIGRAYRIPVIQKNGGFGLLSYVPIQVGGADAVNFQIDSGALQFPRRYDATRKEINFHCSDGKIGISYAGKSGDVIKHTNSVITSPTRYYWSIAASATSAATWDFTGLSIVNANITFRPVMTFSEVSCASSTILATNASSFSQCVFSKCVEVTAASSSFSNCEFTQTTSSTGALSITSATIAGLQTELNKISSCVFTNNTTGAGLVINYTGSEAGPFSLNLTSGTFSGNTFDIKWAPTTVKTLTVNVSGTANAGTITSTLGSASISNPKTLTVNGIPEGAELRIRQGAFTLAYSSNVTGGSYVYNYQYVQNEWVRVSVTLPGYTIDPVDTELLSTNTSITVVSVPDPSYV